MEQMTLFDNRVQHIPLASRLRPDSLSQFVGQEHLSGEGRILRKMIEEDQVPSMIFWGPPGVGKTTLAGIIAKKTRADFINFSAVTSGIKEIKEVMQQDAFLPYVERGSITLIGATTENPSFEVNAALLSRCRVFVLKALEEKDVMRLLRNVVDSPEGFPGTKVKVSDSQIQVIARFANGDARTALNVLEMAVTNGEISAEGIEVTDEGLEQCVSKKSLLYDKSGEEHYNMISALHKSMRNSDPDAAIYWMCRMLEGGENPLYIARRLVRFASEDIGMADSQALQVAVAAYQACHFLGMPECDVHLTHAVTYLAMAPKSNALYVACEECKRDVKEQESEPVPLHLRNAVTGLMKELHYGEGYQYAHDTEEKLTAMQCLPDSLKERRYYRPTEEGAEKAVREKLQAVREWKADKTGKDTK